MTSSESASLGSPSLPRREYCRQDGLVHVTHHCQSLPSVIKICGDTATSSCPRWCCGPREVMVIAVLSDVPYGKVTGSDVPGCRAANRRVRALPLRSVPCLFGARKSLGAPCTPYRWGKLRQTDGRARRGIVSGHHTRPHGGFALRLAPFLFSPFPPFPSTSPRFFVFLRLSRRSRMRATPTVSRRPRSVLSSHSRARSSNPPSPRATISHRRASPLPAVVRSIHRHRPCKSVGDGVGAAEP